MNIFLDTEFTNFHAPMLLSIGLAADNGATFYAELEGFDLSACSEFVIAIVLKRLGRRPDRIFDANRMQIKLSAWLAQFACAMPKICYDFDLDWTLMAAALDGNIPAWLAHENVDNRIDDLMREQFYVDTGLPDHHALYDAQANRFAYRREAAQVTDAVCVCI